MNPSLVRRAAAVVTDACLRLQDGDQFAIVRDGICGPGVGDAVVATAEWVGATVTDISVAPTTYLPMREFGRFAQASFDEPKRVLPEPVLEALDACDAALLLTSDLSLVFDGEFRDLVGGGNTRFVWMPYIDAERFVRLVPQSRDAAQQIAEETSRVADVVRAGGRVHVTSRVGTDLSLHLGEYRTNASTGIPGTDAGYAGLELLPGGQVARVPDSGSATGTLVIDGSVNAPEYEQVDRPIELEVREGTVTSITGGLVADKLRGFLETVDRGGEAHHLTEFAIGTNPDCRFTAQAGPAEDTHRRGAVSFAIGADVHLGGSTAAACHVDMTMLAATVELEDQVIVDSGAPKWDREYVRERGTA